MHVFIWRPYKLDGAHFSLLLPAVALLLKQKVTGPTKPHYSRREAIISSEIVGGQLRENRVVILEEVSRYSVRYSRETHYTNRCDVVIFKKNYNCQIKRKGRLQ